MKRHLIYYNISTCRHGQWESNWCFTLYAIQSSDHRVFNVQESIDILFRMLNEKEKLKIHDKDIMLMNDDGLLLRQWVHSFRIGLKRFFCCRCQQIKITINPVSCEKWCWKHYIMSGGSDSTIHFTRLCLHDKWLVFRTDEKSWEIALIETNN